MAGGCADADLAGALVDVAQLVRERVDIDHVGRSGEAQLHHRQQAVSAREQPRLRAQLLEQRKGMLHARGALVTERGWNLQDTLLRALLNAHLAGAVGSLSNRDKRMLRSRVPSAARAEMGRCTSSTSPSSSTTTTPRSRSSSARWASSWPRTPP